MYMSGCCRVKHLWLQPEAGPHLQLSTGRGQATLFGGGESVPDFFSHAAAAPCTPAHMSWLVLERGLSCQICDSRRQQAAALSEAACCEAWVLSHADVCVTAACALRAPEGNGRRIVCSWIPCGMVFHVWTAKCVLLCTGRHLCWLGKMLKCSTIEEHGIRAAL